MEGKEAIINKILSDADKKAEDNIHEAEKYSLELKENAEIWAKAYFDEQSEIIKKDCEEIVKRRKIVANLEVRKIILNAKQNAIEEAFNAAYESLCKMSKEKYLEFVCKLIKDCAEDGDVIVLSKDGVLTAKDFEDKDFYTSHKLSVQKERGEFIGGVKLIGAYSDKDLTFKSVIEAEKDEFSFKVAEKLFG